MESPPFRALSAEEDAATVARINASGAGIVFVGLGCPKQERWMAEHRGRVNAVMIGVGAAFDFHSGKLRRAPAWMRDHGLEWLHRLVSEPGRLGRRYLVTNSLFIVGAARQLLFGQRITKFK
jgi:N-acetylglucosaminyldiphosphoundecaprenol N-acetyl-beta-D-mannosaminyltransferase